MDVHDYYFITPFILFIISLLFIAKTWIEKLSANNYTIMIFSLALIVAVNSYTTGIKTWKKINDNVNDSSDYIVFNEFERKNNFWIYWLDREQYKLLEKKDLPLDSLGITFYTPVFCVGDNTINRSLYLLNRRGYTNFNTSVNDTPHFLGQHPEIKFVILIDPHLRKEEVLRSILTKKIFEKENISIYSVN